MNSQVYLPLPILSSESDIGCYFRAVQFSGGSFLSVAPILGISQVFPLTMSSGIGELDVAGSWTSDVYRWMRTAPAASYLQPLEGIPFFPRFHLSGVLFFFTFSTGAGAVRPCTAITHCRKRLNVFMCKRLSLKLPAGLSLCAALYTSLSSLHSPAAFHNSN